MMTAKQMLAAQEAIENEIYSLTQKTGLAKDGIDAIIDGVADCAAYLNSSPRVAWILKEPYDDKDPVTGEYCGGGWSLMEGFLKEGVVTNTTLQRIIYVMYGLRNDLRYQDMDWISDNPEMGHVLRDIAFLNLSKMPAGTTSGDRSYAYYYNEYWKPILKKQIELYDPEVIVFGNTFDTCWSQFIDEGTKPVEVIRNDEGKCFINVYKQNGRILLDAYHPGLRNHVGFYVDSLIDTIKRNY